MVYLALATAVLLVFLIWRFSLGTDPCHSFMFSLLPLLDLEHTVGRPSVMADWVRRARSEIRWASQPGHLDATDIGIDRVRKLVSPGTTRRAS